MKEPSTKPSARPLTESEKPRQCSVEESVASVKAYTKRKRLRKERAQQRNTDPNDYYLRNGSFEAAEASAAEARRRQGERDEDEGERDD